MLSLTPSAAKRRDSVFAFLGTLILALLLTTFAGIGNAQTTDLIVLTPDNITGEVSAKVISNTNDPRFSRVCIHRIDQNAADPDTPVSCLDLAAGRTPTAAEIASVPDASGLAFDFTWTVALVSGQDQLFSARNYGDVGGGVEIRSADSPNSALIPQAIGPPVFIVVAPSS